MDKEGRIDSVVGKDTTITGDIKSAGSIKIDGALEGNVELKESIILGREGTIKGNIICRSGVIGGKIEGSVDAQDVLEFQTGARMVGDMTCKGLIIQQGVFFEGNCRMSQKSKEKV